MHIVFEGADSAGKTSSCHRIGDFLKDKLQGTDIQVVYLHQPGDTPIGDNLRHLIKDPDNDITKLGAFYVMGADHAQFCEEKLKHLKDATIANDKIIILQDRHSSISGYVNAVARYGTVSIEEYKSVYDRIYREYPYEYPDIVVDLIIPPDVIVENLKRRGFSASDRYEAGGDVKDWEKVVTGYKEVPTKGCIPSDRYLVLDGDKKKTVMLMDEVEGILGHKNMVDGPIRDAMRELYKYLIDEIVEKKLDKGARRHGGHDYDSATVETNTNS